MWKLQGLVLGLCLALSQAFPRDKLYPFGSAQGDSRLQTGDDISSEEIRLQTPVVFYDGTFRSLYVNLNGHVTFDTDLPAYQAGRVIPIGYRSIAVFLADIDTRLSGNVYYRETQDPSLLDMASGEVRQHFHDWMEFQPLSLFVITWDEVGYWREKYDKTNTFQMILASDGRNTFVFFHYVDDGINWLVSEGKTSPMVEDVPAQAGFDAADRERDPLRSFRLPGSGTENAAKLNKYSNVNIAGKWIYMIGNTNDGDIQHPDAEKPAGDEWGREPTSCRAGGAQTCHSDATCEDLREGFCCKCNPGYFGNGRGCVKEGDPQRVNGKLFGNLNGHTLDDIDVHAYIISGDGRAYTAVGHLPATIGYSMQSLYSIGGILGWMFASTGGDANMKNGYMLTGGELNRTATIEFLAGGESTTIRQSFSQNAQGYLTTRVDVNGNIPNIATGATLEVDDFTQEYTKQEQSGAARLQNIGTFKSYGRHTYRVDGIPYHMTVDQSITYKLCAAKPDEAPSTMSLGVSRIHIGYQEADQLVRYSMANSMAEGGENPCDRQRCGANSHCRAHGQEARCECNEGYRLDRDGFTCIAETCDISNNCDANGRCAYDPNTGSYRCVCNDGFSGDGYECRPARPASCDVANNCHRDARCLPDQTSGQYACRCNPGFTGDGYRCERGEGCNIVNDCDYNARCVYESGQYVCRCNPGFDGDGKACREEAVDCNVVNNCDINAECRIDQQGGTYYCQCRAGYTGDGYSCRLTADCRRDPGICDSNARCDRRGTDFVCVCNPGYHGDGRRCAPEGDQGSYLMYAQGVSILQMPFQPSYENPGKQAIYIPGQTAIGIDVDCYSRYFYWTDVAGKLISRAKLDGTDSQVLVKKLGSPEGVAIDWMGRNMYWTDSGLDRIEVSRLDGSNRKTLFDEEVYDPRSIVVDPLRGYIFWTDWRREAPKIERADMDGGNRMDLVTENLGLPNGITIDYTTQRVCFADAGTMHIECVNYQGRARQTIFSLASYPFGIVFANEMFYWTDWDQKSLPNINQYGGQPNEPLTLPPGGNGRLYGIAAVQECPRGSNACALNNGGCRFLCLPTPNGGRTCACPDDVGEEECNRIGLLV